MRTATSARGRRIARRGSGLALLLVTILALAACGGLPTATLAPGATQPARSTPTPTRGTGSSPTAAPVAACSNRDHGADTNRTRAQLPDCSTKYNQHDGEAITHVVATGVSVFQTVSEGVKLTFAVEQPELVVLMEAVARATVFADCAQEKGIANWRVYSVKEDSRATGLVLVASEKQIKQETVLCAIQAIVAIGNGTPPPPPPPLSPCVDRFSYQADNDTYFVIFAATMQSICADFRAGFSR